MNCCPPITKSKFSSSSRGLMGSRDYREDRASEWKDSLRSKCPQKPRTRQEGQAENLGKMEQADGGKSWPVQPTGPANLPPSQEHLHPATLCYRHFPGFLGTEDDPSPEHWDLSCSVSATMRKIMYSSSKVVRGLKKIYSSPFHI